MARLFFLGGARWDHPDVRSGPATRRHPMALLALLATAPGRTLGRGKLAGLLWPEAGESRARNRLSTCVHQVRTIAGQAGLVSTGDALRLDPQVLHCDVCEFEDALAASDAAAAVALYRGAFLDGFDPPGGNEVEMWVDRERARLRRGFRTALEILADRAESAGDRTGATGLWQRLWDDDPFDARVTLRLMRSLADAGNRAAALRVAAAHRELLTGELDVEPSGEVEGLAARLRRGAGVADPAGQRDTSPSAVAVLPFDCRSGSEESRTLADGLHGDLLTELSRVPGLLVISRTSVLRYKSHSLPLQSIAEELGVRSLVEGEVQHIGDQIRLRIQLIDAERDAHIWADRYDRKLDAEGLFTLQSDLTQQIARALEAQLTEPQRSRLAGLPTTELEAYRHYVRGRVHLDQRTPSGMQRAVDLFRTAAELDPEYAAAWAGLALSLCLLVSYYHMDAEDALEEAESAARRALRMDPDLGEGHAALAMVKATRMDGPGTIESFRRARELDPGNAQIQGGMAYVIIPLGFPDEGFALMEQAARLDPHGAEWQWGLAYRYLFGWASLKTALSHVERAEELAPGYAEATLLKGQILATAGRADEAIAAMRRALGTATPGSRPRHLGFLAHALAQAGRPEEARRLIPKLEASDSRFYLAVAYAAVGALDDAFAALAGASWPPGNTATLRYDPVLERVRNDPRYPALLREVERQWGMAGAHPPAAPR